MNDFFHGWRRRFGLVTLLMACLFTAGWVRSGSKWDQVYFTWGDLRTTTTTAISAFGRVSFSWGIENDVIANSRIPLPLWETAECTDSTYKFVFENSSYPLNWQWLGFASNGAMVWIPYWFIVIPLTMLAAFLLLLKPSQSTSKKTVEPMPEKVM